MNYSLPFEVASMFHLKEAEANVNHSGSPEEGQDHYKRYIMRYRDRMVF